jgi:hypothetical protein
LIYQVISDQEANSVDPDQTAQMCWLMWIYTIRTCDKTSIHGVNGKDKAIHLAH